MTHSFPTRRSSDLPDVLVIALGLDPSEKDPLAFAAVTTAGFSRIGERLGRTPWPTLIVQEGGYVSDILGDNLARSEEHTSELQSLMRISYAVSCLKKNNQAINQQHRD